MTRYAWCARCNGPTEADERGCISCRQIGRILNAKHQRYRRARLRAKKLCINGIAHGPATHGCRCGWCFDVHKRGVEMAYAVPRFPMPPSYDRARADRRRFR
jgi:hypothetical protein